MNLIIILLVALLIIFNLTTKSLSSDRSFEYFNGCGAGCGNPQRFPTYKRECWSVLDANPPPDPHHFYFDYGPLCENKATDNDFSRWILSTYRTF